jgi:Zn finger protein HypA/HybF involved in hydrogenase expression
VPRAGGWKPARISSKFDHGKFGFRLDGAHAAAACTGCHASLDFSSSSMQCASCHQVPHRGEMGIDCARCHSARSFVDRGPMVRAHQLTRFPLTGSHAGLDCEGCHQPAAQGRLQFVNTQAECRACHMNDFRAAKEPDHVGGGFSTSARPATRP